MLKEYLTCHGFLLSVLVSARGVEFCPSSCTCTVIEWKGLIVDCSFKQLKEVPDLPSNAIRLYLQNNSLTRVSPGALDHLQSLEEVDLSNNPWTCDCNIFYLKHWLQNQRSVRKIAGVRCAAPATVSMAPVSGLSGNEITGCRRQWPVKCIQFLYRDLILFGFALLLLLLMSCAVRISKRLACRVIVTFPLIHVKKSISESQKSK